MYDLIYWTAGSALLLFWFLYREFKIAQMRLKIKSLQRTSRIYVDLVSAASRKYDALLRESNLKEIESEKEISELKDTVEQLMNRVINFPKEKLQSTSGETGSKKISPNE
jgi:hypothetical protein